MLQAKRQHTGRTKTNLKKPPTLNSYVIRFSLLGRTLFTLLFHKLDFQMKALQIYENLYNINLTLTYNISSGFMSIKPTLTTQRQLYFSNKCLIRPFIFIRNRQFLQ